MTYHPAIEDKIGLEMRGVSINSGSSMFDMIELPRCKNAACDVRGSYEGRMSGIP